MFIAVRDLGRPTLREVAVATHITPKQAKHALQRLRYLGWIEIDRETRPAGYYAIRDGIPQDGRGMAEACAIGRQKRFDNLAKARSGMEYSPWKFPPVPELEKVWPMVSESLRGARVDD